MHRRLGDVGAYSHATTIDVALADDKLLFDGVPWVSRAQDEHDAFADALRTRGVEVLYIGTLLAETLAVPDARSELTERVLADTRLGDTLRRRVSATAAATERV